MIARMAVAVMTVLGAVSAACAQAAPTVSVASLLKDGYDVKTAFADASGGAYLILQRGTSAYMCHSSPRQTCEKLN